MKFLDEFANFCSLFLFTYFLTKRKKKSHSQLLNFERVNGIIIDLEVYAWQILEDFSGVKKYSKQKENTQ